jgi:hypothetical protein
VVVYTILFTIDITAHLDIPQTGKCWVRVGFCGVVSLNLVEEDYKDKQFVMRYETPRLTMFFETTVIWAHRMLIICMRSTDEVTHGQHVAMTSSSMWLGTT